MQPRTLTVSHSSETFSASILSMLEMISFSSRCASWWHRTKSSCRLSNTQIKRLWRDRKWVQLSSQLNRPISTWTVINLSFKITRVVHPSETQISSLSIWHSKAMKQQDQLQSNSHLRLRSLHLDTRLRFSTLKLLLIRSCIRSAKMISSSTAILTKRRRRCLNLSYMRKMTTEFMTRMASQ